MGDRTDFVPARIDPRGEAKDSVRVGEEGSGRDGGGRPLTPDGSQLGQPSYFLARNFKANAKANKRTADPKGDRDSGAHEQMKCLLKKPEDRNALSWVARNDPSPFGVLRPKPPSLHPAHSQVAKCNLWDSRVSDTFHKPLQDLLSGSLTHRFSESSSSNQNFRLSNIQSVNDSQSDKQQSMLRMSREWHDKEQLGDAGNQGSCQEGSLCEGRRTSGAGVWGLGTLGGAVASQSGSRLSQEASSDLRRSTLSVFRKDDSAEWDRARNSSGQDGAQQEGFARDGKHSKSNSSCASDDLLCKTFDVHPKCVVGNSCLASASPGPIEPAPVPCQALPESEEKACSVAEDERPSGDCLRQDGKVPVRSKLQYKKNVHLFRQKASEESPGNPPKATPKCKGLKGDADVPPLKEHSMFSTVDSHQNQPVPCPTFDRPPQFFDSGPHCLPPDFFPPGSQPGRFNHSQFDDDLYVQDFSCGVAYKTKGGDKRGRKVPVRKSHPVDDLSKYAIDVDCVPEDKTTVMIKNIPNRYKKDTMLELINKGFSGTYDFFYLPIDLERDANVGYAFVNFKASKTIRQFYARFSGLKWTSLNSDKVCDVSYARIQGLEACLHHFKDSSLIRNNVSSPEPEVPALHQQRRAEEPH